MKFTKARMALAAILTAALVFACHTALDRALAITWPEFPEVEPGRVQSVTELEPRFGWRTGDVVAVVIYLKESGGIVYDTGSLALKGDARLRGYKVDTENDGKGAVLHRIKVEMQAFTWKQVWQVVPTISCRRDGKREVVELPSVSISTSRTFDGDKTSKHPEDAPLDYLASYHWLGALGVAFAALAVLCVCVAVLVRRFRALPAANGGDETWVDRVRVMTDAVDAMASGAEQSDHCRTIDRIMREAFGVESVGLLRLHASSSQGGADLTPLILVLSFCQDVVYAGSKLSASDLEKLRDLVVEACHVAVRQAPETAGDLLAPPPTPVVPDRSRRLKLWLLAGVIVSGLLVVAALAGWAMWMDAQVPVAF